MPDRHPSDSPQWGPARTYRARPGRKTNESRDQGVPIDDIREEDLLDPDGNRYGHSPADSGAASASRSGYGSGGGDYQDDYGNNDYSHDYDDYEDYEPAAPAREYGSARPRRRLGGATRSGRSGGRKRRRPLRFIIGVLVLVLIAYPLALAWTVSSSLHRVDALSGAPDTPGRNYLLVGSDSRTGTDLQAVEGTRTDTIVLLHVPASGPTVLLSLPRDSEVEIPGHGKNKINASYAIGGPPLLVETVEQASGVRIDGYIETGFAGFGDIVNALGGITICPKTALQDKMSGLDVQPGCQPADGTTALAYARMRHGDPLGDLGRVQRQREVISQIATKATDPRTLINPFSAFPLARAGGKALTVDKQLGLSDLAYFGLGMRQVSGGKGLSLTVPISNPGKATSHGTVVVWDKAQSKVVFNALKDDSMDAIVPIAKEQAAAQAAAGAAASDG